MKSERIRKGVILAAGDGDRMGDLTKHRPKILLPMNNGEPLILSPIRALASSGIRNIAIIVGYLADKVRYEVGDGSQYDVNLHYLENPEYLSGNAISVLRARQWTEAIIPSTIPLSRPPYLL
ncbi:sugar phosphate nucleotidyltransferase [Chloroflexota bacterium]